MNTKYSSPEIWVGCLAAYNNGKLHGCWIDMSVNDAEDVHAEIQKMLKASPEPDAEEWEIMDVSDWPFDATKFEIEELCNIAHYMDKHGDAFCAWMQETGQYDFTNRTDDMEDSFMAQSIGVCESPEGYAYDDLRSQFDAHSIAGTYSHQYVSATKLFELVDNMIDYSKHVDALESMGISFVEFDGQCFVFDSSQG